MCGYIVCVKVKINMWIEIKRRLNIFKKRIRRRGAENIKSNIGENMNKKNKEVKEYDAKEFSVCDMKIILLGDSAVGKSK